MRSVIRTNPLVHAAAAFVVGGLAVLIVHRPEVALLHALGSRHHTVKPSSNPALMYSGVPLVELLKRD